MIGRVNDVGLTNSVCFHVMCTRVMSLIHLDVDTDLGKVQVCQRSTAPPGNVLLREVVSFV